MDDKITATNIGVTLSIQMISASLTMITVIGALIILVTDRNNTSLAFYILFGLGFISFLISIVKGGKGIDKVRKQGFNRNWNLDGSKSFFNQQAIYNVSGIVLCLISFIFTTPQIDEQSEQLKKLNYNFETLINRKDNSKLKIYSLELKIKELTDRIEVIERQNTKIVRTSIGTNLTKCNP